MCCLHILSANNTSSQPSYEFGKRNTFGGNVKELDNHPKVAPLVSPSASYLEPDGTKKHSDKTQQALMSLSLMLHKSMSDATSQLTTAFKVTKMNSQTNEGECYGNFTRPVS